MDYKRSAERSRELRSMQPDELDQEFKRTLAWYFSDKMWPSGFLDSMPDRVERVATQFEHLNKQLAASAAAQTRLALALVVFTFLQVIVGAFQIFYRT